jgi:hypothetical protein
MVSVMMWALSGAWSRAAEGISLTFNGADRVRLGATRLRP